MPTSVWSELYEAFSKELNKLASGTQAKSHIETKQVNSVEALLQQKALFFTTNFNHKNVQSFLEKAQGVYQRLEKHHQQFLRIAECHKGMD